MLRVWIPEGEGAEFYGTIVQLWKDRAHIWLPFFDFEGHVRMERHALDGRFYEVYQAMDAEGELWLRLNAPAEVRFEEVP